VGVETADGDAWGCDAFLSQKFRSEFSDGNDALGGEVFWDIGEGDVNRGETDTEGWAGEEHTGIGEAEGMGEEFGLAWVGEADVL